MLWRLRLWWYGVDKAAGAFALYFGLIVGALGCAFYAVSLEREAAQERVREFHARSVECLARNVYYEARGESAAGQYAVAEVTMNRKASPLYPKTVCQVVYQKEAFSWTAFEETLQPPAGEAWRRALKVAEDVYYQRRAPTMEGVLHFHATYVKPDWANERQRVARIGRHVFYR